MTSRPPRETSAVIWQNPFCMRIFTVPSRMAPVGTDKVELTCPGCRHQHEYTMEDFHDAWGPEGTALNPV